MLVELASTPVAAGLFFLYIKDKYEKEPWKMLFLGVLFGLYTAAVVYALGSFLEERFPHEETPFYTAFFSSAGVEEAVKFLFLFFLIWGNRNFNEPLDGIVYGVFVSLGFVLAAMKRHLRGRCFPCPDMGCSVSGWDIILRWGNTAVGKDICRLPFSVLILPMHCIIIFC